MNWDQIAGNWRESRLRIKERWTELTDDDVATIRGQRDRLVNLLQEKCGYAKGPAEKALNEFMNELEAPPVYVERS
jgi:uncharacterized protein YjbJ (UPF0337 family)